jgi:Tfp pilus assembly protein PilF
MSKARHLRTAFLAAAVLFVISTAFGQSIHSIQGKVSLPNGNPPPAAVRVTLTFNGMHIYETFTDMSGRFFFSGVSRGRYQLTAEGDGQTFETTRVDAEVPAFGGAPQVVTQNIQLRLKPSTTVPRAGVTSVEEADPNIPARAREEYQKGMKDAGDNKPEKAVKHFQEAIAAHPQFYSAYVALAEQCGKINRDEEAGDAYRKALELKPDHAQAYVGLGVMLVKQKKYDEALQPLRRSLEIDTHSSTPYLFLGLAEMMTRDFKSSEEHLLRAYELGKPALAHLYLANLYDLKHEPAKAIEQLKAFLKENPHMSEARQDEIRAVIDKLRKQLDSKK